LIVLAVIFGLVALCGVGGYFVVQPVIESARLAGKRAQDQNNLWQIGLAVHNYHDVMSKSPQAIIGSADLPPEKQHSWLVAVLPYLEQQMIYQRIDLQQSWDAPSNAFIRSMNIPTYQSFERPPPSGQTNFVGITGLGRDSPTLPANDPKAGFFGYNRQIRLTDVLDGTSQTQMVAQTHLNTGPWSQGGPSSVRFLDPGGPPYLGLNAQFGTEHGASILLADGSVRYLQPNVDPRILELLATMSDGQVVPPY
jgi:hypothetical protein